MTENQGKTASALRVGILTLLAVMCYQLGYNAGFTSGNWESRRQQLWEAVGRSGAAATPAEPDAPEGDAVVDLANLDAPSAPKRIRMCPAVVLDRFGPHALPPATLPARVAQASRIPHAQPLAAAPVAEPRS